MPDSTLPNYSRFITTPYGASFALPEKDQQALFEVYVTLPPAVRAHLSSGETGATIRALASRHGVAEEQAPGAALALMFVIIGRDAAALPQLLQALLSLKKKRAQALAQDLDDEVLVPIQTVLKRYWQQTSEQERALFTAYGALPARVREHLASDETGVNIRAVLERHDVPVEHMKHVALALFYTVAAQRDLAEMLVGLLSLTREDAEAVAQDLADEVLAPIRAELDEHWRGLAQEKKTPPAPLVRGETTRRKNKNVLDLKKRRSAPKPPPMPKKKK